VSIDTVVPFPCPIPFVRKRMRSMYIRLGGKHDVKVNWKVLEFRSSIRHLIDGISVWFELRRVRLELTVDTAFTGLIDNETTTAVK
jgi:hypothetical protein